VPRPEGGEVEVGRGGSAPDASDLMTKRYSVTRSLEAAPEVGWGLLTDAARYAGWNPTIVTIQGLIVLNGTVSLVSTVNPKRT
jgi:hypothetical protein